MRDATSRGQTVLDRLVADLRARGAGLDGQEPPAAILWTDPKGEWRGLLEPLRTRLEELLVFGDYRPAERTGPAVWLRCLIDRTLGEPTLPEDRPPVLYLPGVGRQQLRAGEQCPDGLKPLVELMFRGALWLQPGGSDWTVLAFLVSPKGLGLSVARDTGTTQALLRAVREVALTPVAQLEGRQLQADDFDRLLAGDLVRDLLRWMGDPATTRARLGENGWEAFCNRCQNEMAFDPGGESEVVAGERLARGEGAWATVWERFTEAPTSYPGIAELLRRSRPAGELRFERERWPDLNEEDEVEVRNGLAALADLPHEEACRAVLRLEAKHGPRRGWVWARMGLSPMAMLLEPLARLAEAAVRSLGGGTPDEMAAAYLERGWPADAAAWEALALAPATHVPPVASAVRHLLEPWLDESARAFQKAAANEPLPAAGSLPVVEAGDDVCLVFVDGLRMDLGQRLVEQLEGRGYRVALDARWAATPTVTATAKPAVTPVAGEITGDTLGDDFAPSLEGSGKKATSLALREAMARRGYQVIGPASLDAPLSHPARGWLETGEIDALGHKLHARLARQLPDELDRLAERIAGILDAGWKAVRIVTDHGWLLLPGGLPKVDLPKHLTASRWSRCAVVAGEARPAVGRAPWSWNVREWFATAPGVACFNASAEYAHGGLSIQECLIPDIRVERAEEAPATATIRSVTWRRLRCFVEIGSSGGPVIADIRLERPSGQSVAHAAKPVEPDGAASLVLKGDEYESSPLVLVVVDEEGRILAHKPTRVGVDS